MSREREVSVSEKRRKAVGRVPGEGGDQHEPARVAKTRAMYKARAPRTHAHPLPKGLENKL